MYIDFKSDESYTPNKISIKAGTVFQDLKVSTKFSKIINLGNFIY